MLESETTSLNFFETIPVAIILTNLNGTIINVNAATEKLFGYTKQNLISKNIFELFITQDYSSRLKEFYEAILKEKAGKSIEIQVNKKDENLIWLNFQGNKIQIDQKDVMQLICQDITTYKIEDEAKQELLESEEKYRLIVENISDSISILSPQSKFEYVNPSYTKLIGYSRTELLGKFALDIMHPDDNNNIKSILDKLFRTKSASFQIRMKKKNADYVWVEVAANFFKGKDGKSRILSVARDITGQKAIEDAIKTKSLDLIFLVDLETRRLLEANFSFSHLLGYSSEEIPGLTLYDIMANKPEIIDMEMHPLIKEQSIFLEGEKYKKKDGTLVDVEIRASPITFGGRKVVNITSKDITIQKILERKLEESKKRYRHIVENVKDGVIIIGFDGKFQFISPQIYDMMGGLDIGIDLIPPASSFIKMILGP